MTGRLDEQLVEPGAQGNSGVRGPDVHDRRKRLQEHGSAELLALPWRQLGRTPERVVLSPMHSAPTAKHSWAACSARCSAVGRLTLHDFGGLVRGVLGARLHVQLVHYRNRLPDFGSDLHPVVPHRTLHADSILHAAMH